MQQSSYFESFGLEKSLKINCDYHYYSILNNTSTTKLERRDFLGGAVVENLPADAGDTGSSPGLGRSHMPRSN